MPERTTLLQAAQVGVESTKGTAVPANRRLAATSFDFGPELNVGSFRPAGYKFPTLALPGNEWSEGDVEGVLSYTDLVYLLHSVIGTPAAPTQPAAVANPGAYRWVFTPQTFQEDDPTTFTVEVGSTVRAHRIAYGLLTALSFSVDPGGEDGVELGGSIIGRKLQDGVTLTAAPTEVEAVPVLPQHVSVYLDDTFATIGTTKLNRLLSLDWELTDRFGPLWVIDRDLDGSYAAHLETEPNAASTIMVEADTQGMGLLADARVGTTAFLQVSAQGAAIPGGDGTIPYAITVDMPVKVTEVGDFSDEDGVYAMEFTLGAMHDATMGSALKVTVDCDVAAL